VFLRVTPLESEPPARRKAAAAAVLPAGALMRFLFIITLTSMTGTLIFNFTTNGNGELLRERMVGIITDPATLGMLLAAIYVMASFAQIVVGVLIDRVSIKWLYGGIVLAQLPLFWFAIHAQGWWLYALMLGFMTTVFGSVPFTDAMIVRYVDDRMRSRIAGTRFTVVFGASSLGVWALGPVVKASGFTMLLTLLALISIVTFCAILALPDQRRLTSHAASDAAPARGSD
jgi:hypothetical protein